MAPPSSSNAATSYTRLADTAGRLRFRRNLLFLLPICNSAAAFSAAAAASNCRPRCSPRPTRALDPALPALRESPVPVDGGGKSETIQTAGAADPSRPEGSVEIIVPKHYMPPIFGSSYPSALHSIHVQPVLSDTEAAQSLALARQHASETGCWDTKDNERHSSYATVDFPIEECESLASYLEEIGFHRRILDRLGSEYGLGLDDMTYLDFFCANYEAKEKEEEGADDDDDDDAIAKEGRSTMDSLAPHRDGSLVSFTVLLTPPSDFEGGGTTFDALRDVDPSRLPEQQQHGGVLHRNGVVRPKRAGDCTLHSGKLLHGADPVTSGSRTVLVAFVDVADWCQRPNVLSGACKEFGRMDVASYRLRRQNKMTGRGGETGSAGVDGGESSDAAGWFLRNARWLPQGEGRSHVRGYVPAFETVRRRGDEEFQRRKKLEAEDILLRSILLKEDERDRSSYFGNDVTVL